MKEKLDAIIENLTAADKLFGEIDNTEEFNRLDASTRWLFREAAESNAVNLNKLNRVREGQ